jgi:hypothetical protein
MSEASEILEHLRARKRQKAAARGLTAKWSKEFGFISIHDPTTGEVNDIPTKDAPKWALNEAATRKRLYRSGRRDAFELTSAQMEAIWEKEHFIPEEEGIQEEHTDDLD